MGKCDEASVEVSMGDSASPMKPDNFTFTVPPEAPVFEPTPEEFQDPLAYISKIRPIAEKSGICKIKPPEHWQPPFAVDVDRLRFTPRIQRLNELEAITRVKLNFLDQIIKFWELQGSSLKIPTVEKKPLDLYALHKIVKEAGGFDSCTAERKWSKIARRMCFPQGKGIGSILKSHYERILYPYDVFKSSGAADAKETKIEVKAEPAQTPVKARARPASRCEPATPPRRARAQDPAEGSQTEGALPHTPVKEECVETRRSPRENKWMSSGASCASRVTRSTRLREHRLNNMTVSVTPAPTDPAVAVDDPLAKYMCRNCGRGDIEEQMLLCDGCDDSYHTFCLMPPLAEIPKGDWRCPVCIAEEVSKPTEAFGFEQASREYTLQQFGEMADQFKSDYFNMPVHMVPTSTVEREFWRVVSSIDEDVTVEYGADLHTMDHGSGFPTKSSAHLFPGEQQYAESSWNLNNLPVLQGSVLGYINADISGMKVPWLYVGMCFAAFCWHNEDHWSYSINYLHWGEPKTWYGVPGSKAEQFEAAMQAEAPELFQLQPDLLHQLVTIMNPNALMKAGVPVYRTDQHAGEFVVTFPRAYHAGFNQGYNFAEAVNFTPADWLKMGRECIAHYSTLRRNCVFSHDELVCKMALQAERLSVGVALAACRDMRAMLHDERRLRKQLLDWGVTSAEREAFELVPDDERQCAACKTTCFLSCVACRCGAPPVCPRHAALLCRCAPAHKVLRYRYTLDELGATLERLRARADACRAWADAARAALQPAARRVDLERLRLYRTQARELQIERTELVRALDTAIEDAEKCLSVIHQLELHKMRTRRALDHKYRLTVEELRLFAEEIDGLACVLPEGSAVKEVLRQTEQLEARAAALLALDTDETNPQMLRDLEEAVELGSHLCIVLEQLPALQARLLQVKFLESVREHRAQGSLSPALLDQLLRDCAQLVPCASVEAERALLTELQARGADWEARARAMLSPPAATAATDPDAAAAAAAAGADGAAGAAEPAPDARYTSVADAEALLDEAEQLQLDLPSYHPLSTALNHAKDWLHKVEEMQSKDLYPYYHSVEQLVRRGQSIPLALYEKQQLSDALLAARQWKQGLADMFLTKNWNYSLMEALCPRVAPTPPRARRRAPRAASPPPASLEAELFLRNFTEAASPADIVAAFKQAEGKERALISQMRTRNMRKELRTMGAAPSQSPAPTFCICQKKQHGVMTQCELCKDWFHASCVAHHSEWAEREARDRKFLCCECVRTKRPRLETILSLLVWLQRLPVRVPEGEALQCVTERAMAWQEAARAALARADDAAAAADRLGAEQGRGRLGDAAEQNARSVARVEHAYSASPRARSPRPARSPPPPAPALQHLEDLMLEGDLLEVSLEEQSLVWAAVAGARRGRGARRVLTAGGKRRQRQPRPHARAKRTRPASTSSGPARAAVKRGGATTTNYLNRKQGMSASGLMMRKHYMARQERRQRAARGRQQRRTGPGSRGGGGGGGAAGAGRAARAPSTSSTSSGDDDEDCAAGTCLRPTGKEVDWVQCDGGCDGWFHMHCVGLAKGALLDDDDYICTACQPRPAPRAPPRPPRDHASDTE